MTNTLTISRELAERLLSYEWFNQGGTQNGIDLRLLDSNELSALLAAPVVERQEPVYQTCNGVDGWIDVDRIRFTARQLEPDEYECRVLYTSPPAPVAVVLPDRKQITGNSIADVEARAHNACLDKVKEMNR